MHNSHFQRVYRSGFATLLILAGGVSAASVSAQEPLPYDAEFHSQLSELYRLQYTDTNAAQAISRYERMIETFSENPQIAEAMYNLACYCQTKRVGGKISSSWFRKAIESSEETSWIWAKANMRLSRLLRWGLDGENGVREARTMVESVASSLSSQSEFPDRFLILAEVELGLMMQCFAEGSQVGTERHFRRLLDWNNRSGFAELSKNEQRVLLSYQTSAAQYLIIRIPQVPGTKKGRTAWLKRFTNDYADRQWLQEVAQPIYHQISEVEDPPPPPVLKLASSKDTTRAVFVAFNFIVVLVLCGLVFRNRILNRHEASKAM